MLVGALVVVLPGSAPAAGVPDCGGIAANPSVEAAGTPGGPPQGYLFTPAAPVPRSTPADRVPKLSTSTAHAVDGQLSAQIQTPEGRVSSASQDLKAVPGGQYTLSVWAATAQSPLGSRASATTGLRFANRDGRALLEKPLDVTHDVASDGKLARQDLPPVTAPDDTSAVSFFASANHNWVIWDCVRVDLAAYTAKMEVQDAAGKWGPSATLPAGEAAHFRIALANTGTQPLTAITVKDPWCQGLPGAFDLAAGATRELTCEHPNLTEDDNGHVNTAKIAATGPGGPLAEQKATATVTVTPQPAVGKIGDRAWKDLNRNGLQDDDEPGYPDLPVTLKDGAGGTVGTARTNADGMYLFDQRKDGTYQVCFDVSSLPDGLTVTPRDAGEPGLDSAVDPATGCTSPFTLGGKSRERMDLDIGLAPPAPPSSAPPSSAPSR